jgi:hypothetical protein
MNHISLYHTVDLLERECNERQLAMVYGTDNGKSFLVIHNIKGHYLTI